MEFKAGDLVQVKSGGPAMTIKKIDGDDATCTWMDKTTLREAVFALVTLQSYRRPGMTIASVRRG